MSSNDTKTLPNDLQSLKQIIIELVNTLDKQNKKYDRLQSMYDALVNQRYGRKGERLEDIDPSLLLPTISAYLKELQEQETPEVEPEVVEEEITYTRKKSSGRKKLPASLERETIIHDIDDSDRACKCCGEELEQIGQDTSEQLEYIPARLFVIEHARLKYACKACQGNVVTADKPRQPIEKGLPAAGLLSHIAISKYADHLPLYRQEAMLKRYKIEISRSTMCDWMASTAELLRPLEKEMTKEVLKSKVINTDDTTVKTQDKQHPKNVKTGRLWIYRGGDDYPYSIYDYTPNRKSDGPKAFLETYKYGYLQADAYAGYDCIFNDPDKDIKEILCWAHARRKFHEARGNAPKLSHSAIAMIKQLYDIEKEAKELPSKQRHVLRQEKSVPILKMFKEWLESITLQEALPQSNIRNAINYTLNGWEALCRYTEDGDFQIDNNSAERLMKPVAIGRKNWMFFGSDKGGRTAATIFTIIQSAKRHNLNLYTYLKDIINRISDHPANKLDELLPDKWKSPQK